MATYGLKAPALKHSISRRRRLAEGTKMLMRAESLRKRSGWRRRFGAQGQEVPLNSSEAARPIHCRHGPIQRWPATEASNADQYWW
jgi:hypothetical protein